MPTKRRVPQNTERDVREFPLGFLAAALAAGSGGAAIESQEARGQQSFVNSETLPKQISEADKKVLVKAGVKFLGPVENDPIFQCVELPKGWQKKATDHSMWSDLLDGKGRKRAGIFYKAAFYDRSAHLSLNRRYRLEYDYARDESESLAVTRVMDGDQVIFTSKPVKLPSRDDKSFYDVRDNASREAATWLKQHFPNYEDPGAYWD